jgi:hypothetical protein
MQVYQSLAARNEFALSFQMPHTGSSADVTLQMPSPLRRTASICRKRA